MNKVGVFIVAMVMLAGCIPLSFVKTYDGDYPQKDIVTLTAPKYLWDSTIIKVEEIDGRQINEENPDIRMLVGEHTVVVTISGYNDKIFVETEPVELTFTAESGKTYFLRYREGFGGMYRILIMDMGGTIQVEKKVTAVIRDVRPEPAVRN